MPTRRQQSADDQFQKREPRAFRAGLHDLTDPSAKGRWEAGLEGRFHGVCGRLVAHPLHGNLPLGDTLVRNPHWPSKSTGLETPVPWALSLTHILLDRLRLWYATYIFRTMYPAEDRLSRWRQRFLNCSRPEKYAYKFWENMAHINWAMTFPSPQMNRPASLVPRYSVSWDIGSLEIWLVS